MSRKHTPVRHHPVFACDDDLAVIGNGLLDRTLPKSSWTHAGHFAATLWMLGCRPDLVPSRDMPAIIRAYNLASGGENTDTAGYHETITQASIRAAQWFLATNVHRRLSEVCNALLASPLGDPDWLLAYWTRERLFSVQARRQWCEPDVRALPFARAVADG